MARRNYNTYRGRKSWGRKVLIAIVVVLVIALALAVAGYFLLRNYIVYTDNGPQLVLPVFQPKDPSSPTAPPTQGLTAAPDEGDEGFVIESAPPTTPTPTETPAPTPTPTLYPRRTAPLGLVNGGMEPAAGQGVIFDESGPATGDNVAERNQGLSYAAAYVGCPADLSTPMSRFETLAYSGYDEIVVDVTGEAGYLDLAGFYDNIADTLNAAGYQGYLSVVCRRALFTDEEQKGTVLPAVAKDFERVYAAAGESWSGLNIYSDLKGLDFRGTTADIVTVVYGPVDAYWAWAVLP